MRCEKHATYNGIKWKKKRCPNCDALYKQVHTQSNNYGKYKSLTTPDTKCGIIHLICEVSCLMLYDKLPPFFWLKSSNTPQEIRQYFHKMKMNLERWEKTDKQLFKNIEIVLYRTFVIPYKKQISNRMTVVQQEIKTGEKKPVPSIKLPMVEKKKNKWEILNG